MADSSSPATVSLLEEQSQADLLAAGLPSLSPIRVTISKRFMLEQAIERIGGALHKFMFTDTCDDEATISVSVDLPAHSHSASISQHLFYGQCIESTCAAALTYLKDSGIVVMDDSNFSELQKCQRKLQAEQFWSAALLARVESLSLQLSNLTGIVQPVVSTITPNTLNPEALNNEQLHHETGPVQLLYPQDVTIASDTSTPPSIVTSNDAGLCGSSKRMRVAGTVRRPLFSDK